MCATRSHEMLCGDVRSAADRAAKAFDEPRAGKDSRQKETIARVAGTLHMAPGELCRSENRGIAANGRSAQASSPQEPRQLRSSL